jgi:large-conductance mechanosensitive channel
VTDGRATQPEDEKPVIPEEKTNTMLYGIVGGAIVLIIIAIVVVIMIAKSSKKTSKIRNETPEPRVEPADTTAALPLED